MNVIDTITLAGTLVLALPIGMLGVEFLVTGRPLVGVGFLAVAAALVVGQHYLEPDVKGRIAGGVVDLVVPDEGESESGTSTDSQRAAADGQAGSADGQSGAVDIPSATADAQSPPDDTQRTVDDEEVQRT